MSANLEGRRIVFVCGEDEYESERTMPLLAHMIEELHGAEVTVLKAYPDPASANDIPGLEALRSADLAIFYIRFRELPEQQFAYIREYLEAGKPVVGFRTSTHAFRYAEDHPLAKWNDGFGIDVLGAPWIRHFGHSSTTDVSVAWGAEDHPILRGVPDRFTCRSWLYQVLPYPPEGATLLLNGHAVNPEDNGWSMTEHTPRIHPITWTRKHFGGGRVFTTTMGHPDDFEIPAFERLITNGIYWALGYEQRIEGRETK
ncbi:ThuA domain-containing protein [Cohnella silvisoli]|uniref:ThuA domain-containing protein n=1 Tax=Cohnella silvisoli TaxID=2873699 RepID=A0ABV1KW87_9BACL|nr:ThuA domain-containing protein [Cohnella silvisoli]MCD9023714.1 ThuA domain-containing protein [Cohnella silvisoli]